MIQALIEILGKYDQQLYLSKNIKNLTWIGFDM